MMRVSENVKKAKKVKVYKLEMAILGLAAYAMYLAARGLIG